MESLHGRDSLGSRDLHCIEVWSHSWKVAWCPSTTKRRNQFGFDTNEGDSDRELVLNCFQEGVSEVGHADHLPRAAAGGCQQRWQERTQKRLHRKPAKGSELATMNMSKYERVFMSLKVAGMFVKLSKIPGGGVGAS